MEAQEKTSTSASRTSTDTESSFLSSSDESSEDDDRSERQERCGKFDRRYRNSRPKVKMKHAYPKSFILPSQLISCRGSVSDSWQ
jgi:hypothetical protein